MTTLTIGLHSIIDLTLDSVSSSLSDMDDCCSSSSRSTIIDFSNVSFELDPLVINSLSNTTKVEYDDFLLGLEDNKSLSSDSWVQSKLYKLHNRSVLF